MTPSRASSGAPAPDPASASDDIPRQRDVLIRRTPRIEPTYALHICRAVPPDEPPALTCHGLRQAIRQADALARERTADIWYTDDGAHFVRLVRYRRWRVRAEDRLADAAGLR